MSAAKKKKSPSAFAASFRRLFSWLIGPGRHALIFLVLFGLFGGGWYFTQRRLWPRIAGSPEYRVTAEQVEITPPPDWIHTDVLGEVFRSPALDGPLSIMDDDLADRIAAGFARHPWVARVQKVSKNYPADSAVRVELLYRKPVCMIESPGGLWPVDADAVLLPTGDFSPPEAARYPRLLGVERGPTSPAGQRWTDARVIGGAEIAAAIGDLWEPMRLRSIEPLPSDPTVGGGQNPLSDLNRRPAEPFFILATHSGTRILWGYAPGANALGEPTTEKKIAWLKRYFADHDSLDGPQGRPQELNVHRL